MLPYTREIISFFSIEIKAETEYNILVAKMFGLIFVRPNTNAIRFSSL